MIEQPKLVIFGMPLTPVPFWILYSCMFARPALIVGTGCLLVLYSLTILSMIALFQHRLSRILLRQDSSLDQIRSLRWFDFEFFVGEVYRLNEWVVEMFGGPGPDGGIDMVLHRDGLRYFVQCKHYTIDPVGVAPVRELYGVMAREGADGAKFVTSGTFSTQAREEFQKDQKLELVDGSQLMLLLGLANHRLSRLPATARETVVEDLTADLASRARSRRENVIERHDCPNCGAPMVLRPNSGANRFWGCLQFPKTSCPGKLQLTESEREILDPGRKSMG